ncbi:MAG: diguanylate cyclase [Gammaproteobacteria bacterium]
MTISEQDGEDLEQLIPHLRDVVFRTTHGDARWAYLSPAWTTLTGYGIEESLGQSILALVHPDDRVRNDNIREGLATERTPASRHTKRLIRKDGSVAWVEVDVRLIYDADGNPLGSVGTLRDISERIQLQETLQKERQRARTALTALSDGVITLDADLRIEFMNAAAFELTGLDEAKSIGQPANDVLRLDGTDLMETIADSLKRRQTLTISGHPRLIRADGTLTDIDVTVSPLADDDGREDGGCVIVLRDVREERALQAKLTYQANHDLLTHLSNRASMQEALAREHARAMRRNDPYTLLLIDLDHFKIVNDHYGHALGDEALKAVARAIRSDLREGDWLSRWGGEEFLCLLPGTGGDEGAYIAERIRYAVETLDITYQGSRVSLSVSIGVSSLMDPQDNAEAVLLRADAALYEAKRSGRNQVWRERQAGLGMISMAARLQEALRLGRLGLAFQPIVDVATGTQVGSEALARMWDEKGQRYQAGSFIDAARHLHLLHHIDAMMIPLAMGHCTEALLSGTPQLHFVNVSADLLRRPELVLNMLAHAEQSCARCGGEVGSQKPLVIELSEREFLNDTLKAREALAPLIDFGMQLAIDHFGSGYASLRYLGDLPVNYIKVEGELLRRAIHEPRMRPVIIGIRQMAEDLGFHAIAEKVEDAETDELVRELDIRWAQGSFYGSPLEPAVGVR